MDCCSPGESPFDCQFNARHAAKHLRAYRQNRRVGLTRALIEALAAGGSMGTPFSTSAVAWVRSTTNSCGLGPPPQSRWTHLAPRTTLIWQLALYERPAA